VADHWSYGRWALGSSGLSWVSEGVYYVVLPVWGGLAASGVLKALTNLIMPVAQAQSALSILMVPGFVRARREGRMSHVVPTVMGIFAVGALAYWMCLGVWHHAIVHWIYGGQYDGYSALLWIFGVLPLLGGVSDVLVAVLRAMERPDLICRGYVGAAALAVSVGIVFTAAWRVGGAALGYACSLALLCGTLWLSLVKLGPAARGEPVRSAES
jgi:O-antigen/teichoic acid export membrane protein